MMCIGSAVDNPELRRKVLFIKAWEADGFDCAYKGQTGHISAIEPDGTLVLLLACGHVLCMPQSIIGDYIDIDRGTLEVQHDGCILRNEGNGMAKSRKGKISNVNGVVPIQGYSQDVEDFKFNHMLLQRTTNVVTEAKKRFRKLAAEVVNEATGDVTTVEFLSEDGSATVPVSIPDVTKDSNRVKLTPDTYKDAINLGFDIDELGVTQSEDVVTLTGAWATWFIQLIDARYREKGLEVHNLHEITESTRTTLTVEGIKKLQTMAEEGATEQERKLAKLLLDSGIKSPAVAVK